MNDLEISSNWYQDLILDIKKLEFTGIVITKHAIGKRILLDFDKFGQPGYGSKRIENIAKDADISTADVYNCLKFARKFPELSNAVRELSWRRIVNKELYEARERPETPPLPDNQYNIIYADPPWDCWEGGYENASQHYDLMNVQEICSLPIRDIAADNCILFLWAIWPQLPEALKVIETWGFSYSTIAFNWIKANRGGDGFFFGLGNWTRANSEICLLARRGSIKRQDNTISQIVYEPLIKHSQKPAIVRDKIIQLVGDLPRIELFAREAAPGWSSWGNEVNQGIGEASA